MANSLLQAHLYPLDAAANRHTRDGYGMGPARTLLAAERVVDYESRSAFVADPMMVPTYR
jgi:hypothetical protein